MDFGIVEDSRLMDIDFSLPADGAFTRSTLSGNEKFTDPELRIGLAKWGRKDWVGKFYPDRTKEYQFLHEYTKRFNTIELNAVFYSIPPVDLVVKWRQMVAKQHQHDFLFLPKFSRVISHIKRLSNAQQETNQFIETVKCFGAHLGPIFLQIGDNFGPKNLDILQRFIEDLPTDHRFFIELRHEEWFSDTEYRKIAFDLFKQHQIGAIITDAHGRRDCLHMELPIPEAYIRFNGSGNQFQHIDLNRIDEWAVRIKSWVDAGLQKLYFIISQKDEKDTPVLAQYAIERFNVIMGTKIPSIEWKKNAAMTDLPTLPGTELLIKHLKRDIENGRGEIID